ncbi:UNKNOWN [Stylonychia lemnae]|uniref:Uncharacterized protein n=1 Tax=Stylonychia lemnae TaxID=5949 RepID=A0A078B8F3_STYLE|nr:UNKNOWN [Stylonychia lemnae]|eukprot:CDW89572.1 UNKNOWN [Stylonychia lemnae]
MPTNYLINTTAPMFIQPIEDQTIVEGQLLKMVFPKIVNKNPFDFQLKLGKISVFTKFTESFMEFQPEEGFIGLYEVSVKLIDQWNKKMFNQYSFKISVIPKQVLNITEVERIKSIKQKANGILKARIRKISNNGIVSIVFNKKVIVYSNFDQYLNESLEVLQRYKLKNRKSKLTIEQ